MKKVLDSHNLGTEAVTIEKNGDTVVRKGTVKDQSIFEKAIVAMSNTLGISKVEASELKIGIPENKMALDGSNIKDIIAVATPANDPKFQTVEK